MLDKLHFLFLEEYNPLDNDKLLSDRVSIPRVSMTTADLVRQALDIEQLSEKIMKEIH
jgi:hypothetical protein